MQYTCCPLTVLPALTLVPLPFIMDIDIIIRGDSPLPWECDEEDVRRDPFIPPCILPFTLPFTVFILVPFILLPFILLPFILPPFMLPPCILPPPFNTRQTLSTAAWIPSAVPVWWGVWGVVWCGVVCGVGCVVVYMDRHGSQGYVSFRVSGSICKVNTCRNRPLLTDMSYRG